MTALTLESLHDTLQAARTPEEIFGTLAPPPLDALRCAYRHLVRIAHPDHNPAAPTLAQTTFTLLESWRCAPQERIRAGLYGTPLTEIRTRKATYTLHAQRATADYAAVFSATRAADHQACTLKLTHDPANNDLATRDAETLRTLSKDTHLARYLPRLLETFLTDDGTARRRATIFESRPNAFSLEEVRNAYPAGLDPRDAAWIFNRLLEALTLTHEQGVIHGAILPPHSNILTDTHGTELTEWAYAVDIGQPLTAIPSAYQPWYPPETFAKSPATPATDLFLAARTLLYLLGANPLEACMPKHIPAPMQRLLHACLLPAPHRRPQSASAVRDHFRDILQTFYGPPTFRPFSLPP